jgi:hypothetical protein
MFHPSDLFHHLRRTRVLAAWVLAWWTLSLAAAVITPVLAAQPSSDALHQLCSALGTQPSADQNQTTPDAPAANGWHCVLCLGGAAPLAAVPAALQAAAGVGHFARAAATPALYSRHAGPAPARGPPGA